MCLPINRYAFFLPTLGGGGAERAFVDIANELANQGKNIDLVVAQMEGPNVQNVSSKVELFDLRATRTAYAIPGLRRYLQRYEPIGLASAMPHANVTAIIAAALARTPTRIVISERANPTRSFTGPGGAIARRIVGWFYRRAHGVVAVSESVRSGVAEVYSVPYDQIRIIYNPVDISGIYKLARVEPPHPWLEDRSVPVIIAAGRLTDVKGFDTLITAFSHLRNSHEARLIILGEGPRRAALEALVEHLKLTDSVLLPGYQLNPFVYMAHAQLFVVSSISEGFPNVLIQAMACGAAVVSTSCGSAPSEILESGKWGRIVPVGNVEALAEALTTTLRTRSSIDTVDRARDFAVTKIANDYYQALNNPTASLH